MAARRFGAGLLLVAAAGCGDEAEVTTPPAPAPAVATFPAASAGGVCGLLDYGAIEEVLGTRFDVAAASAHKDTATCVVQANGAPHPDLMLSVTETAADAATFTSEIAPDGAKTVKGLGKAAYRTARTAAGKTGPTAEVGWLTGDKRLITLRYTCVRDEPKATAEELSVKLVELAKAVERAEA
ncbi:hypothetical protein [Micromonospora sp. CPCC 206061]|uniref:hypothetical protein n=1 Tax=Micromonospora sp. CPCC 206061 TaxID=3122410 RepID=UPI002FF24198